MSPSSALAATAVWLSSSPIPVRALVRSASPSTSAAVSLCPRPVPAGNDPAPPPHPPRISAATPCYDSASGVYRPAGDVTVYSIDASTGRLFLLQNQQQQTAQGNPLSYFPIGCGAIDFHLGPGYLYTAEASDPASGNTQVVYAYTSATPPASSPGSGRRAAHYRRSTSASLAAAPTAPVSTSSIPATT